MPKSLFVETENVYDVSSIALPIDYKQILTKIMPDEQFQISVTKQSQVAQQLLTQADIHVQELYMFEEEQADGTGALNSYFPSPRNLK